MFGQKFWRVWNGQNTTMKHSALPSFLILILWSSNWFFYENWKINILHFRSGQLGWERMLGLLQTLKNDHNEIPWTYGAEVIEELISRLKMTDAFDGLKVNKFLLKWYFVEILEFDHWCNCWQRKPKWNWWLELFVSFRLWIVFEVFWKANQKFDFCET